MNKPVKLHLLRMIYFTVWICFQKELNAPIDAFINNKTVVPYFFKFKVSWKDPATSGDCATRYLR
jgi:hypothetical protein